MPEQLIEGVQKQLGESQAHITLLPIDRDGQNANLAQADAAIRWDLSADGLARIMREAQHLRWLHSVSAGVEAMPFDELRARNIILTNAAGVYAIPIAEWVMTAMLMAVKRVHEFHNAQLEHHWVHGIELSELYGKTVLILGLGGIGREVARRASAFGMHVWGMKRSGTKVDGVERVFTDTSWREALKDADFVVNALPLTSATRGLIGKAELMEFKPTTWLINIGRGATIDEAALLEGIQHGRIGGAALDAWTTEPLPPDHPAWSTPNLIVWPHNSGSSPANVPRGLELLLENIKRFAQGQDLVNVVDLNEEY